MATQDATNPRLNDYIASMLPWAQGHQRKGIPPRSRGLHVFTISLY